MLRLRLSLVSAAMRLLEVIPLTGGVDRQQWPSDSGFSSKRRSWETVTAPEESYWPVLSLYGSYFEVFKAKTGTLILILIINNINTIFIFKKHQYFPASYTVTIVVTD